jgi:pyruvate dehydrogenase E1 component alpha subunit
VRTYGIDAHYVPRNDVVLMLEEMTAAAEAARVGNGPVFLEVETYRWREHVGPGEDYDLGYRSRDELRPWVTDDQVARVGAMLDADQRRGIESTVDRRIDAAIEFAEASPFPDPADLLAHVMAD